MFYIKTDVVYQVKSEKTGGWGYRQGLDFKGVGRMMPKTEPLGSPIFGVGRHARGIPGEEDTSAREKTMQLQAKPGRQQRGPWRA